MGAHESVAGGLHTAFERISRVGGTALQIFTRNQRQWQAAPVNAEEAQAFALAWNAWGPHPVFSHASYLINPAAADPALWQRGLDALTEELRRCAALSVPWVVLHPGARGEAPADQALDRVARCLAQALEACPGPGILLENTAGQGSSLGARLEDLSDIARRADAGERLAFCLDTCHAFAAGYDVRSRVALDAALAALPPGGVRLLHVNDSKGGLSSRLDRHEHIGQGAIGLEGFRAVLHHPGLDDVPLILETHKGKDLREDVMNLAALRNVLVQEA